MSGHEIAPGVPDLRVRLGPLVLRNPVMPASGCFNVGREVAHLFPLSRLGAIVNKTVMPWPHKGNPPPRMVETPCGLVNAIGIPSDGPEAFIRDELPFMRSAGTTVIVSIGGFAPEDYGELAARMAAEPGVDALELNLSCPNHRGRGLFALRPDSTREAVEAACRGARGLPVIAKLSPMVTDIVAIARAALEGGACAVTVANTYPAMAIDIDGKRPTLAHMTGGLSGPAIRPITLRLVWEVVRALPGVPVIAAGGVATAEDAVAYLLAGARAVQVGTALFANPMALCAILDGLEAYLQRERIPSVEAIIGLAQRAAAG